MAFKVDPLRVFLQKYRVRKFDKGELILVQGETPATAFVVKKGVVKTYNITAHGEEKPISFDIQNEIFPIAWVFGMVRGAPYYYEAFTNCEVYCVPREDYKDFLGQSTARYAQAYEQLVTYHLNTELRLNGLEQSKASAKILYTLYYLCVRYGEDARKNLVRIQVPLTQQDLANFMGLTRETTGIELKKMQRAGLLTYKRQNYFIRTDKLNKLLDEEHDQSRLAHKQVHIRL